MWNKIVFTIKAAFFRRRSAPDKKFVRFLNLQIKESLLSKYGRPSYVMSPVLKYGLSFAIFVIILGSGVGVYADQSQSVTETHPLYPVKRSIENFRKKMATAPKAKAEVNLANAERRLNETEVLSQKNIVAKTALREADTEVKEALEQVKDIDQPEAAQKIIMMADKLDEARTKKIEQMIEKQNGDMKKMMEAVIDDESSADESLIEDATSEEMPALENRVNRRVRLMGKFTDSDFDGHLD